MPKEQGKALLVRYVAEAIAELEGRLEMLEEVEERDRELAMEAAAVDTSPEGMRRLRYEMRHERAFRAALKELRALQAARPAPGDAIGAGLAAGTDAPAMLEAPVAPVVANLAAAVPASDGARSEAEPAGDAGARSEANEAGSSGPVAEDVGTSVAEMGPGKSLARALARSEANARSEARPVVVANGVARSEANGRAGEGAAAWSDEGGFAGVGPLLDVGVMAPS